MNKNNIKKFGNIIWFSNLSTDKQKIIIDTGVTYEQGVANGWYQKYDNYDAINVNKISQIPMDYNGIMGVPITFIDKYNPEQFEIVGVLASASYNPEIVGIPKIWDMNEGRGVITEYGKEKVVYSRLLIRKK